METQPPRDPWRILWQAMTGDYWLFMLVLGIAGGLLIAAVLPQTPAPDITADATHYSHWLSGIYARFGDVAPAMQKAGLFTITRSFGFRVLLALLNASLLLRLIETGSRLRQQRRAGQWSWSDLFPFLAQAGGWLIIVGLFITQAWGWRAEGLIVQAGQTVQLPNGAGWAAADETARRITHSPGLIVQLTERGPGLIVEAQNPQGHALWLQRVAGVDAVQLPIPLTEDQYFAIPDAGLVVYLSPRPLQPPAEGWQALVQAIRTPSGQMVGESLIAGHATLTFEDVTLRLIWSPYARLTAISNPGLWPTSVGLLLGIVGLAESAIRSARRTHAPQVTGIPRPVPKPEGVNS